MTFIDVLNFFDLCIDVLVDILSYSFFSIPLWLMLAGLYVSSWVVGFIVKGNGVQFSHFQDLGKHFDSLSSRSGGSALSSPSNLGLSSPSRPALSGSSEHSHSIHSDSIIVNDYEVL